MGSVLMIVLAAQLTTISPGGVKAIGPKQDDPRALCGSPAKGIIVQGGREAIGPKQDDPRKLAIGPKQDDPLKVGVLARPGDDNDPKASGGSGADKIVVQGGIEAIGPKQDDPRKLAIGPKQDDPLKVGVLARPGDDNDPKAIEACEVQQR
jgi:hypothetical protein